MIRHAGNRHEKINAGSVVLDELKKLILINKGEDTAQMNGVKLGGLQGRELPDLCGRLEGNGSIGFRRQCQGTGT